AEQAAHLAAHQWQTTFDAVQDGICLLDPSRKVVRCNQAMGQILGQSPEQLVGRKDSVLADPAGLASLPPRSTHQREVSEVHRGQRWFRVTLDPARDEEGRITGWVAVWVDITQRKQAEETIRRLALIVESSDDAIAGKTLDGVITSWNPGAVR